jgi:hypothetical protein
MAHMANDYRIVFHKPPAPGAPFKWEIRGEIVSAFSEEVAVRLARRALALGDEWLVRSVEDLGKWNQVQELM